MELESIVRALQDPRNDNRLDAVKRLAEYYRLSGERIPLKVLRTIFKLFAERLDDSGWRVAKAIIDFLRDLLPDLGVQSRKYFPIVFNSIIDNFGVGNVHQMAVDILSRCAHSYAVDLNLIVLFFACYCHGTAMSSTRMML